VDIRSRVLAVLNGQKPDVVPWLGDLDYWVQWLRVSGRLPEKYAGDGLFRLHRDLGVGFYLQGYFPFRTIYDGVDVRVEPAGLGRVTTVRTALGALREVQEWLPDSFSIGWTERFVKSWRDLKALRYLYEHTRYEPDYELAERRYDLTGTNGLVLCYLPRSPFMQLVALDAGIEAVTYALSDAPEELEETLAVIGRKDDEASEIALRSPAECLMIPENLSSEVVGKKFYDAYVRPHDERWTRRIREAGKTSFLHIDGTLRGLIREASATGFKVLEAVTPAPVGDIEIEDLHNWVEPETVLWGGLPGVYFTDLVSDSEFDAFVRRVLEVMRSAPRYVLGVADQVPPLARFERIARVRELVETYGRYY
jgi:Uroporphyrinogen decarboxylase (URO-D)